MSIHVMSGLPTHPSVSPTLGCHSHPCPPRGDVARTFDSREELFEIPKGTWARRMAGEKREILPSEIHLLVGIRNVLMLKNSDDVPQIFGPTLLMPGQTLRIPFTKPSENYFACTAHASGQLLVVVEAAPTWPWNRLSWRVRRMLRGLSKP
jgi:hypothetical protein